MKRKTHTGIWRTCSMLMIGCVFIVASSSQAKPTVFSSVSSEIQNQYQLSVPLLFANISRSDTVPGLVVASPSKTSPNYYFHWVRDAALVMSAVLSHAEFSGDTSVRKTAFVTLFDYVNLSRKNQLTPNLSGGLGEPKFNSDGSAFTASWGRPQNDGPALRALTLMRFANLLLPDPKQKNYVKTVLYDGRIPTHSVIKSDLEYVAHHWRETSYDLWEEEKAHHFYTHLVQRSALAMGAEFAESLGDSGAAQFYKTEARDLEKTIQGYWDDRVGYLRASRNHDQGIWYKNSGLDTAVILGSLHADIGDGFYGPASEQILATAHALEIAFKNIYPINRTAEPGVAMGRYPEDHYNGYTTASEGNPWFLITNAFAEYYYKTASNWKAAGNILISKNMIPWLNDLGFKGSMKSGDLIGPDEVLFHQIVQATNEKADSFMMRSILHVNQVTGEAPEQFHRDNGYGQGAADLSWSYASFITARIAKK